MRNVLFLASLDAAPLAMLERLLDSGRLPALGALMKSGAVLPGAKLPLVGVAYPSEYTGKRPTDHGVYFPFQWSAELQRVRSWQEIELGTTIFRRVDEAGRRMVVIDPPECFPQAVRQGVIASGWQFQERILLARWFTHAPVWRELTRRFGRPERTEESFGQPTAKGLLGIHRVLVEAPERLLSASEFFLGCDPPEVLWINFAGLHLASHQFFDVSSLEGIRMEEEDRCCLERALEDLAVQYDRVLGRIVERLPAGADTIVFCTKGIGPVIGWVDLLPEMLRRVLGEPAVSSPVASVRDWVPRSWREAVAGMLPDSAARELAARLWSPRADWNRTRAFTLPSDAPGFVRLNLRGREKLGCVSPDEEEALCAAIEEGLRTFTDLEGEPCVGQLLRRHEIYGKGEKLDVFPDLVVGWAPKKTLHGRGVRSPRYGEVLRRNGLGTGRSGDHAEGALTVVVPGRSVFQAPGREVKPYDYPATILSVLGLPHQDLPGHPLLRSS